MSETIMIEHQELTEFGYATKSREVITRSCKCSFLEQELAKLKEENEKLKQKYDRLDELHYHVYGYYFEHGEAPEE